jgi:hypothetical protein
MSALPPPARSIARASPWRSATKPTRRGTARHGLHQCLYLGNAELDGEGACFCASLKSMPSILARRMIAATTWSWQGIAAAFETSVLVDARGPRRRNDVGARGRVPITLADTPVGNVGTSSTEAPRAGRFMTERRIGDTVRAGEVVGAVGSDAVRAGADGVLLGLAARGARIEIGDPLVEVDSVGPKHACFGITRRRDARRLRVLEECEIALGSSSCCNTRTVRIESHVMHEEHPQCASS